MSDPEVPEPQDKPTDVSDVVDSAKEGLAEAEAAAAGTPEPAAAEVEPAVAVDPDVAAFEEAEREYPGAFSSEPAADAETAVIADAPAAETVVIADPPVAETMVLPPEPVAAPPLAPAPAPQPIFVQAPEPPRPRGNRATAGLIGLLATIVFAALYLGAGLGFGALAGEVSGENIGTVVLAELKTWGFWVPVVIFFLGFWLLGAIINRGRWGAWVIFGLLVGFVAYGGHIVGQLFEAPFWYLTAAQGWELTQNQLLAPLAIAAALFGREVTIWFGAWVARIGARKVELNAEAQREYERTLEAGPTLSR